MGFIKYLFEVSRLDQEQMPKEKKREKADLTVSDFTIVLCSYLVGILIILLAISQLVLTLLIPVASSANVFAIYTRNITSIACFAALSVFLICWCYQIIEQTSGNDDDKDDENGFFKFIVVITCILSLIKALFSAGLVVYLIHKPYFVILYYFSEMVVWLSIAFFLSQIYRLSFTSRSSRLDGKNFRKFVIALIAIIVIKAVVSLLYTLINYNPRFFPWLFYLADALAWFFLAFFFSFYCNSKIAVVNNSKKSYVVRIDTDLEKACDIVAKQ